MRGSLSEGVFERRTSSGSEAFSLIISFDATRFVLVRVLILIGTIWPNLWAKLLHENERASLKNVFSLSSLLSRTRMFPRVAAPAICEGRRFAFEPNVFLLNYSGSTNVSATAFPSSGGLLVSGLRVNTILSVPQN